MTTEKRKAWATLRQNITKLGNTVDALHDMSRGDPQLETVVDDLYVLVSTMKRVLEILAEPETPKKGENPK